MKENKIVLPPDANGGMSITPPQGCEVDKVKVTDGVLTVTFRPRVPKSWEDFCEQNPNYNGNCFIGEASDIAEINEIDGIEKFIRDRNPEYDRNLLPDRATAEAMLSLCQLIQMRNAYNGDWVPDWTDEERKYTIDFYEDEIWSGDVGNTPCILHFRSKDLRDEFLRNFRQLIELLKPLYGIKEGGEE